MDHAPRPRPLVIAHRGASGYRPEHSAAAVRLGFAQGADAVEPDLVASSDGVLVIRHENELSGTTDVADRPEFADRRVTRVVDGVERTGWFTEDMTWAEIRTLRCRERIPAARPDSASHDDEETVLSLPDLLRIVDQESARHGRPLGMVAEIKHATHFAAPSGCRSTSCSRATSTRMAGRRTRRASPSSRSSGTCCCGSGRTACRRGWCTSSRGRGSAVDEVARHGDAAVTFDEQLTDRGLTALAAEVDGISVGVERICPAAGFGAARTTRPTMRSWPPCPTWSRARTSPASPVFTWTLRPENAFLPRPLRGPGPKSAHGDFRAHWGRLLDAGVDGVFADHPDLAVALVEERAAAAS
ncbi:glycerophosphodiester phosphodiesterase family protein [Clavibacter zhangzhiyongii]|uniref:glycerophosphodiester phosphodiesterase family protein n=1 Tax=Clavibacter zhangzhiyongii TaxID=2768071 RepID=UPI0039E14641